MLIELIDQNIVDRKRIVLRYGSRAGLSPNQLLIVLLILELTEENKQIIASSELTDYLLLSADKIDLEIDKLITKKLIVVSSKSFDFSNLFNKIGQLIIEDYSEYNQHTHLIAKLNDNFDRKISLEDLPVLQDTLKEVTKSQLLEIAGQEEIHDFEDLTNYLAKHDPKKTKKISKFNWLEN